METIGRMRNKKEWKEEKWRAGGGRS